MSKQVYITIVDPSVIICKGISTILAETGLPYTITIAGNLQEFEQSAIKNQPDIVLINPLLIQNQVREFQSTKQKYPGINWIGIAYAYPDQQVISTLGEIVHINDTPHKLTGSIQRLLSKEIFDKTSSENLSDRETDVLKLLVAGNASKEIADKLNISTHTVITHRKNISQKTGIKSVSGLTIYAVLKKIISIDDYTG